MDENVIYLKNMTQTSVSGLFSSLLKNQRRKTHKQQDCQQSTTFTEKSTQKRREHLLETKFFECNCARCSDPKELGSYAGALLCPRCTTKPDNNCQTRNLTEIPKFANCDSTKHKDNNMNTRSAISSSVGDDLSNSVSNQHIIGVVLPLAPLEYGSSWKCETCSNYSLTASVVSALLQKINDEYDSIDPNDVEGYESFLQRYRNVLHPNHFLCLSAKLSLSQLYGKVDSHLIHQMSPSQLQIKKDICQDILKVFDIIEPGYSRLRGITLYELHAPLMVLTTRGYEKREISKPELRTRLREVARCLNESATILGIEPKDSSEGIMATAAKDALRQIKDWEKIIGKIL